MKKTYLNSFCARCLTLLVLALLSTNLAWGGDTYTKATSIAVGDKVVLVCETAGMEMTSISTSSTKYGIGTAFSGSPAGTFAFDVVAGSETGSFSFKNGSNYLRWNSGNSLDMVATSVAKNSSWFVTFDGSGNAKLTNANDDTRFILWNKSSPRFACYAGQSVGDSYYATQLYKKESAPVAVEAPTFSVSAGSYTEAQSVTLSCATEGASIYYTTDGTEPSAESTLYESAISVNKSMTIKAIAIKGEENSSVATAAYKITTYANLTDLVADGDPGKDGYPVTVTLTDEVITEFYTSSSDSKHHGVYLKVGEKTIEIYCNAYEVPENWIEGGTVSGTLSNCTWKNYYGTWELCPDNWSALSYTAPITYNITIADGIQHGTVVADMEKAAAGVEVTLTVTPDEGYRLVTLTVKDATEGDVTVTDNKFTMPASGVTVSATFAEIPTHAAKFFVNGVQSGETQNVYEGDAVVFPADPDAIEGYTFVGWTASPMSGVSDEAPEFVTSATMGTEDLNFYAVFAKKTSKTEEKDVTYTFTSKSWADATNSWTSGKDGNQYTSDKGVQVTSATTGANATSKSKFTEVSKVVVNYCTNDKAGAGTISVKVGDGTAKSYSVSAPSSGGTTLRNTDDMIFDNETGKVNITVACGTNSIYINSITITSKVSEEIISNYCTYIPVEVTITDVGWATVCLPFKATITSSNATAYYVTTSGSTLNKVEANVVPAGEGVLLKSNNGGAVTVTFTPSTATADVVEANYMKGSVAGETFSADGYKYYILANDATNGLGFYFKVEGGASVECAAGKAVLAVPNSASPAKEGFPFDEESTGISESMVNGQSTAVYNLNGMQVDKNYNGIVIMNGKKYINK